MAVTLLLVGRLPISNEEVKQHADLRGFEVVSATNLEEVQDAFYRGRIDHVIMGAGIDLDARLAIVGYVLRSSDTVTVHMKEHAGGRASFEPFVAAVATGLREYAKPRPTAT